MTTIMVVCHCYFWCEAVFSVLTLVTFRTLDVACLFPCIVLLNEDISCGSINEAIAIFSVSWCWIYFSVQNFFTITSCLACCSVLSIFHNRGLNECISSFCIVTIAIFVNVEGQSGLFLGLITFCFNFWCLAVYSVSSICPIIYLFCIEYRIAFIKFIIIVFIIINRDSNS